MPVLERHYVLGVVQAFFAVANLIRRSVGIFLGQIQQTTRSTAPGDVSFWWARRR
jgi:hypothetical protein